MRRCGFEERGSNRRSDFGGISGKLRGSDTGIGEAGRGAGFVDGSDQRARSDWRVRAEQVDAGGGAGAAEAGRGRVQETFDTGDGGSRSGDAGFAEAGRGDV